MDYIRIALDAMSILLNIGIIVCILLIIRMIGRSDKR